MSVSRVYGTQVKTIESCSRDVRGRVLYVGEVTGWRKCA